MTMRRNMILLMTWSDLQGSLFQSRQQKKLYVSENSLLHDIRIKWTVSTTYCRRILFFKQIVTSWKQYTDILMNPIRLPFVHCIQTESFRQKCKYTACGTSNQRWAGTIALWSHGSQFTCIILWWTKILYWLWQRLGVIWRYLHNVRLLQGEQQ